jgi:hypothetical protein
MPRKPPFYRRFWDAYRNYRNYTGAWSAAKHAWTWARYQ